MYNAAQTKKLLSATQHWLMANDSNSFAGNIEELRNILRFHEYRYYVQNDPLITDGEYDTIYKLLEKVEKENPNLISKDSPTQRVGAGLIKDFPKTQHLVPMLSLENSYNANDLQDWDRKARELSGLEEVEYCAEPKFDGASISLIYENDLLLRGITRGDGETGDDITPNIKQIKSVPLSAAFSNYGIQQIEIRGEVLLNKNNFARYNNALIEEGLPPLANPRNAAAGSLRIKDSKEVSRRNLEAFLYHVSFQTRSDNRQRTTDNRQLAMGRADEYELNADEMKKEPDTHAGMLEMLWNLGFRSPVKEMKVMKGIAGVIEFVKNFEAKRDDLPYEIDGMVIKVNDLALQEKLGLQEKQDFIL